MRLSVVKINYLSHIIVDALELAGEIDFIADKNDIRLRIKKVILEELKLDDEVDKTVRNILASYSKKIPEGSKEWDIMYQKTFQEEMAKHKDYLRE